MSSFGQFRISPAKDLGIIVFASIEGRTQSESSEEANTNERPEH